MSDLDDRVRRFLEAEKVAEHKWAWRKKSHNDFFEATSRLVTKSEPTECGKLMITAHRTRKPRKFSFSVLHASHRVLGLDVEPARLHLNPQTLEKVEETHWHRWPDMSAAIPDDRNYQWNQWLYEFLKAGRIDLVYPLGPPPFEDEQLELRDV